MKQKYENIYIEKHKKIRRSRQNEKLKQWVMERAIKDVVLGSILGRKRETFLSLFICLCNID